MSKYIGQRNALRVPADNRLQIRLPVNMVGIKDVTQLATALQYNLDGLVRQLNNVIGTLVQTLQGQVFVGVLGATTRKLSDSGAVHEVASVDEVADNIGGVGVSTLGAGNVLYTGGATVDSLKPAEAGADVTGSNVAASISGQGALATQSSVDLATGEVTNKSADNIDESASRKWASESGADVTANNQAATIAGQGALATKNTVATADIAGGAVTKAKIAAGAVDTSELADGAVTNAKASIRASYVPASSTGTPVSLGKLMNAVNEIQGELNTQHGFSPTNVVGGGIEV